MPRPYSVLRLKTTEVGVVLDRPAEWHADEDDVFVVIEGEMHFTLGGEPAGPATTKDNLTWVCPELNGGKSFILKKGEGTHIPAGTWHQWTAPTPATYAVAKVPAAEGRIEFIPEEKR